VVGGDAHCRGELGGIPREADHPRGAAVDARVASVERQLERLRARPIGAERGAEVVEERVVTDVRTIPTVIATLAETSARV